MIITIVTSGGIGGFGLPGKGKTVDTSELAEPLRGEVCRRFDPDALRKFESGTPPPAGADRLNYHLTVTDDEGERHRFDLPEAALPAPLLDLIDTL